MVMWGDNKKIPLSLGKLSENGRLVFDAIPMFFFPIFFGVQTYRNVETELHYSLRTNLVCKPLEIMFQSRIYQICYKLERQ